MKDVKRFEPVKGLNFLMLEHFTTCWRSPHLYSSNLILGIISVVLRVSEVTSIEICYLMFFPPSLCRRWNHILFHRFDWLFFLVTFSLMRFCIQHEISFNWVCSSWKMKSFRGNFKCWSWFLNQFKNVKSFLCMKSLRNFQETIRFVFRRVIKRHEEGEVTKYTSLTLKSSTRCLITLHRREAL